MAETRYRINENISFSMDPKQTHLNNNYALIGCPGSGKTHLNSYNLKNMLDRSHVLIDVKGSMSGFVEYFKECGYTTYHFNLLDPARSDAYSPFSYIRQDYPDMDLLTMAEAMYGARSSYDPFWDDNAVLLLQCILTYLYEAYDQDRSLDKVNNLMDLWRISESDRESRKNLQTCIEVLNRCGRNHHFETLAKRISVQSEKTASCIIQTLVARINRFLNADITDLLSKNEIPFQDFLKKKVCLVITINDADTSLHPVAGLMVTQLIQYLIREAGAGQALPIPVQFHLDDFGSYYIKDFDSVLSTARSRGIGFTCLFQSQAQMKKNYGMSYETIMQCFDTILFFGGHDMETVRLIRDTTDYTLPYIHSLPVGECFVVRRGMETRLESVMDLSHWKLPDHHPMQKRIQNAENARQTKEIDRLQLYKALSSGEEKPYPLNFRNATLGHIVSISQNQIHYLYDLSHEISCKDKSVTNLLYHRARTESLEEIQKFFSILPLETIDESLIPVHLIDDFIEEAKECLYAGMDKENQTICNTLEKE